jgi:hypothetical protein
MPTECLAACAADGGEGELATCVAEGREAAACEGESSQAGLRAAITLLSDCAHAHPDDPLRSVICEGLVQSELVKSQIDFCD